MQYGNYHLTTVEIIYNIVSFIIAVITTIAFTIYAKRALKEFEGGEAIGEDTSASNPGSFEMNKLPPERPKQLNQSPFSL